MNTTEIETLDQTPSELALEDSQKLAKQQQKDLSDQQKLKAYLNRFYGDIHTIRLRVQMHLEIANVCKSGRLKCDQFWGFFQGNVNVSLIVAGMFSIFDSNNKYILKQFVRFLKNLNIYILTDQLVKKWTETINPYEKYRNCVIAHSALIRPFIPEVDYKVFLELLDEFEKILREIERKHIKHHTVIQGEWATPTVDSNTVVLSQLRELLGS